MNSIAEKREQHNVEFDISGQSPKSQTAKRRYDVFLDDYHDDVYDDYYDDNSEVVRMLLKYHIKRQEFKKIRQTIWKKDEKIVFWVLRSSACLQRGQRA